MNKMLENLKKVGISAVLFAPYLAFGQGISDTLADATGWINSVTTIVVGLVFIAFIWGLIKYLTGGTEKKEEARSQMIYSILIMFVIFSIWGIIQLVGDSLGVESGTAPTLEIPKAETN